MNNNLENNDLDITTIEENETVNNNTSTIAPDVAETVNNTSPKKKKRRIGKMIFNIITTIIFIVVVLEAAIGIINMQRISNKEDPIWYLSTKTTEYKLKTVTEYHLGLYKIIKTVTSKETKITLKPFFLSEE